MWRVKRRISSWAAGWCHVQSPAGRLQWGACLFCKTDTFGHAVLQHGQWQVGSLVVYLLIGLKLAIHFRRHPVGARVVYLFKPCHTLSPQLVWWSKISCKLSQKYEINNWKNCHNAKMWKILPKRKKCEKLEKYQKQKNIGRRREVGENPMAAHLQGKTQARYPNPNTTENRTIQPLTPLYYYSHFSFFYVSSLLCVRSVVLHIISFVHLLLLLHVFWNVLYIALICHLSLKMCWDSATGKALSSLSCCFTDISANKGFEISVYWISILRYAFRLLPGR